MDPVLRAWAVVEQWGREFIVSVKILLLHPFPLVIFGRRMLLIPADGIAVAPDHTVVTENCRLRKKRVMMEIKNRAMDALQRVPLRV
jgi:hypothetical protein